VDTVIVHPDRPGTEAQIIALALPILRQYAARFKAQRIVFEAAGVALRKALAAYSAREDAVTMSLGLTDESPVGNEVVAAPSFSCPCGKAYPKQNYLTNHKKHCAVAKGT
jgi:hypothetical protein